MKLTKSRLRHIIQEELTAAMQEGEMADRKWADNPASDDPSQLTAHQQGRQDALDGKEKNPPEGRYEASDYNHGYDKTREEMVRVKEIVGEEVTDALNEAPSKHDLLRNAIEEWMTATGFEPTDHVDLEFEAKKAAKTPRPKDRHPAFQKIMGIGGPWGRGPELEAAITNISYEIMGEEKPEYTPDPEPEFSPSQLAAFAKGEQSSNQRMRRKYTK